MRNAIVSDFRTLKALERAGYVELMGGPKSRTRHWTGQMAKVITVQPGPKFEYVPYWTPFEHRGVKYQLEYFDGCFHRFVTRVGAAKPAFV